ncbi:MAG: lauroyl acyltransferase [Alphaproteobacteria bacterium]
MAKPRPIRHAIEGGLAWASFGLLGLLPVGLASALGGWLGRMVGPLTAVHRRAARNLARALPELPPDEQRRTLHAMWDNLGRVAAEYPHLGRFAPYGARSRVEVVGAEHLDEAREDGKGGIFFSGHVGNWEVAALAVEKRGIPVALIYRAPNNPHVDRLIWRCRGPVADFRVPKGQAGARDILRWLRSGGHLAMLVDQKMNDGIAVPFFGRDAMTAPALAELALKYDVPAYPVRVERLNGARFRITVFPKLEFARSGDKAADVKAAMLKANQVLEAWIRDRPDQWLWVHNRWPG